MRPVDQSAPRSLPPAALGSPDSQVGQSKPQPQPSAAQRPAVPGSRDEFVSGPAKAQGASPDVSSLKQHTLLRQGGSGDEVKDLQRRLGVPQSGQFDAATSSAVKQYQTSNGLKVDGHVGQQTWGSLLGIKGLKPGKEMLGQAAQGSRPGGAQPQPAPAVNPAAPAPAPSGNGTINASVDKITNKGARNQMTQGQLTVNGHTYTYRSGGHGAGNLPNGDYKVEPHMWSRNTPGMVVDGVGFSFALSDKFDPRVGRTRTELRIHPDGGSAGTNGCMGIVGNGATQRQFREDMRAELKRHGGSFTLHVG